jgi:hypothetical protein
MNGPMKRSMGLVALLAAGSCVVGAPPGFSKGDSWTFPLVGALENGQLITPVFVQDKGPYLFLIDPDAPVSSLDEGLVDELKPDHVVLTSRYDDEQDTTHPLKVADILDLKIGTLDVHFRSMWVLPVGVFDTAGRRIRGVIGRDIITDGTVFGFDRDAGVAYLTTPKGFTAPEGASTFGFRVLNNRMDEAKENSFVGGAIAVNPAPRHIADVKVNGASVQLHVDLGEPASQLREEKWKAANLQPAPAKAVLVDEIGTVRQVDHGGVAQDVAIGGVTVHGLRFVPFDDRRWEREDIDGTLGLDYFRQLSVWTDWNNNKVYMVPRASDLGAGTKARIDRWGSQVLSSCPHTACFEVTVLQPGGGDASNAPGAGAIVKVHRDDAAKDLSVELVLEPVDQSGKPLGKPFTVASFPKGADELTTQLDPSWGDATLRVVDASPFARQCPVEGKPCLYTMIGG